MSCLHIVISLQKLLSNINNLQTNLISQIDVVTLFVVVV